MHPKIRFRVVLLFCILHFALCIAHPQDNFCNIRNTSFKPGEVLNFKVYYSMAGFWVKAGTASFTVEQTSYNNIPVYHIVGKGKTASSYEWFYKVDDTYETWLDIQTLQPLKFSRNVREGSTRFQEAIFFQGGTVVTKKGCYATPKCVQDVLSAIYFARNIDYSKYRPGDKIPFNLFLDNELYKTHITFLGRDKVSFKSGIYHTIMISPKLFEGTIFKGGEKMTVWVSDDQNKIPLRIETPITVGSIVVELISFQNLRN